MSSSFYPSLIEGQSLDSSVRKAFSESLVWCQEILSEALGASNKFDLDPKGIDLPGLRAAQFGFYYSLSTQLSTLKQESIHEQALQLQAYWQGALGHNSKPWVHVKTFHPVSKEHTIAITQLNDDFYSASEINCLNEWLDMEPDNAIELSELPADDFLQAQTNILKALNFICRYLPDFYDEMQATTREIILAKPSGRQQMTFGGVSSFALWGALCLNVEAHLDWRKYIPSLIHEYSHNALFAKAMHGPLVNNDPEAHYFSPLRESMRPMDGIFHAAFVSAREAIAAKLILRQIPVDDENELNEFFTQVEQRSRESFEDCLRSIKENAQLSDLGSEILQNTVLAMRNDPVV